jgi:hypothetical protein
MYVSFPAPPDKVPAALLPVMVLSRLLPAPATALVPVSVKFSILAPSVKDMLA